MSASAASDPGTLEAARMLPARLGITPEQLLGIRAKPTEMPTLDDYVQRVTQAVSDGARRAYASYWNRVRKVWGTRRLDELTPLEIKQLAEQCKADVVVRSNSRGGRSAAEHAIAALRCVYRYAVADGLISDADNPAARVPKPRRLASTRRALNSDQLAQIVNVAASTGNDPDLDSLLLRLHIETACRRGGALALLRRDLDPDQCLVRLQEKGETVRWQPALMRYLIEHSDERGGDRPGDQVLRYPGGAPITVRRYDHLWQRIGRHLP